jgi:hypothetical protein
MKTQRDKRNTRKEGGMTQRERTKGNNYDKERKRKKNNTGGL